METVFKSPIANSPQDKSLTMLLVGAGIFLPLLGIAIFAFFVLTFVGSLDIFIFLLPGLLVVVVVGLFINFRSFTTSDFFFHIHSDGSISVTGGRYVWHTQPNSFYWADGKRNYRTLRFTLSKDNIEKIQLIDDSNITK